MLVRRTVRGMLPRKKPKGKAAHSRVKCYIGVPSGIKVDEVKTLPGANIERVKRAAHITVNELCKHMGYKQY